MSKAWYHLGDEEFVSFLNRVSKGLSDVGVDHMFVGGVAGQIHVSNALTTLHNKDLTTLNEEREDEVEGSLRRVSNVDIALNVGPVSDESGRAWPIDFVRKARGVLEAVAREEMFYPLSGGDSIVSVSADRISHKSSLFRLGLDEAPSDAVLRLNLYGVPGDVKRRQGSVDLGELENRFYDEFLGRAVTKEVPYSGEISFSGRVMDLADHLIVRTVLGRPVDIAEAGTIIDVHAKANISVDEDRIRRILRKPDDRYGVQDEGFCNRYDVLNGLIKGKK